ncbi:uncharacterized protein K02A2.6-like [Dendronephthya gigantea]|uniref:uncharacterized protein K02A2.6-like n=1 Tax=Dendronephthya gigantea TaxID=151771 RepID=UPI00106CC003|nr:uncharacterized protein K02A2.6-like [Dendronephthya gigantea]
MAKDVVKSCLSCQSTFDRTYDEPLRPTPLPPNVWHTISVDFKGPLKDGKYILVAYDLYSRYPIVGYCKSTSFKNVKPILDSMFATFGQVHTVKTDNGPPFQGHEFREYAKKKGFSHHRVTPRHPRANGECERFMRNLNKAVRIAERENVDYQDRITGMLEAYRATPHPSTSKSPYQLMFGRKMNLSFFPIRDKVLMKDRRTDRLKPEVGTVVCINDYAVTVRFQNGKTFKRNKSHLKVINEAVTPSYQEKSKENVKNIDEKQSKRIEDYYSESDTDEENNETTNQTQRTRYGREVRKPERLGEWTYY